MSRSFKKFGRIKDSGTPRAIYNRRFRRVNRQRINQGKYPLLMSELIDDYDVCDFIIDWEPPKQPWGPMDKEEKKELAKRKLRYFGK